MHPLFYQLIQKAETKRWFILLDQFEARQTVTAKELARRSDCTSRTIHKDIKQLKQYFETTIRLLGDEEGFHFSFQEPTIYRQKKQALLKAEPLFFFVDQLVQGNNLTNQEWAEWLSLSPARFGRIKRRLIHTLETQYQVTLVGRDNQLQGNEPAIRQLMYDFYFGLPLLPKTILAKRVPCSLKSTVFSAPEWLLDPLRLKQWHQIACWRIVQGNILPPQKGRVQDTLATALDAQIASSLPVQEKAALFLLSLKEEQFLSPFWQKAFIRQFSLTTEKHKPIKDVDALTVSFLKTIVSLHCLFFPLPHLGIKDGNSREVLDQTALFEQMKRNYFAQKKRLAHSIQLTFQLTGSSALQEWIKKMVRKQLEEIGYSLLENQFMTPYIRQIMVTNDPQAENNEQALLLSYFTEEKEIREAIERIR